jgi:hypothetical protein
MKGNLGAATALGIGYLFGRQKKFRAAAVMAVATAAGSSGPGRRALRLGAGKLGSAQALEKITPQLGGIADTVRDDLMIAVKAAAMAAVTNRIDTLTDSLHERAEQLRNPAEAGEQVAGEAAETGRAAAGTAGRAAAGAGRRAGAAAGGKASAAGGKAKRPTGRAKDGAAKDEPPEDEAPEDEYLDEPADDEDEYLDDEDDREDEDEDEDDREDEDDEASDDEAATPPRRSGARRRPAVARTGR